MRRWSFAAAYRDGSCLDDPGTHLRLNLILVLHVAPCSHLDLCCSVEFAQLCVSLRRSQHQSCSLGKAPAPIRAHFTWQTSLLCGSCECNCAQPGEAAHRLRMYKMDPNLLLPRSLPLQLPKGCVFLGMYSKSSFDD